MECITFEYITPVTNAGRGFGGSIPSRNEWIINFKRCYPTLCTFKKNELFKIRLKYARKKIFVKKSEFVIICNFSIVLKDIGT
jgi:hypothetical protein